MTKTIKTPRTVREAGDMAEKLGITLVELLDMLGPIPMPPSGYSLIKTGSDKWVGPEIVGPRWIATTVWNASTAEQTIEIFTATHVGEKYTNLTPGQALAMAADLIELAQDVMADGITAAWPARPMDNPDKAEGN